MLHVLTRRLTKVLNSPSAAPAAHDRIPPPDFVPRTAQRLFTVVLRSPWFALWWFWQLDERVKGQDFQKSFSELWQSAWCSSRITCYFLMRCRRWLARTRYKGVSSRPSDDGVAVLGHSGDAFSHSSFLWGSASSRLGLVSRTTRILHTCLGRVSTRDRITLPTPMASACPRAHRGGAFFFRERSGMSTVSERLDPYASSA